MKHIPLTSFALCLLGALLMAAPAYAGGGHYGQNRFMRFFDANEDGAVTTEEFNQASAERFKRMDSDADGKLTEDEFASYVQARRAERHQRRFARMDSNGDNKLTLEEFFAYKRQRAERKFARMDEDGDGVVTAEEFSGCRHHGSRSGEHGPGTSGKRDSAAARHSGAMGRTVGARVFARLDADGDGQVTQAESHAAWRNWFARLDANGDNTVSADEVRQARTDRRGCARTDNSPARKTEPAGQ